MTKLLSVIVAALFAAASVTAVAQEKKAEKPKAEAKKETAKKEPSAAQKKQQERMKECNMQADDKKLKGDDRKKYMSSCLKPAAKKAEGAKASSEAKKADKK